MPNFEDLEDDILFIILGYLSADRFGCLQRLHLVSKRFKHFASSILFKNLVLADAGDCDDRTTWLIERILDTDDDFCRYPRHLEIASFQGDDHSTCLNSSILIVVLHRLLSLHQFSWNVNTAIHPQILDTLQSCWPASELALRTTLFDIAPLRSNMLRRLDVSVAFRDDGELGYLSAFGALKDALIQSKTLRSLCIRTHKDPYINHLRLSYRGPLNLPFHAGERLPPLDDINIKSSEYDFSNEQCAFLLECVNWSRVRRLGLGQRCPNVLLEILTGSLPNLEFLELLSFSPHNRSIVVTFILSLFSLAELIIHVPGDIFKEFASANELLSHLNTHLRKLSIQGLDEHAVLNYSYFVPALLPELDNLASCCTSLESLDIGLPLKRSFPQVGTYRDYRFPKSKHRYPWTSKIGTYIWPHQYKEHLCQFLLRHLTISVRVHLDDYRSLSSCTHAFAPGLIGELWEAFFERNVASPITTITMRFWCWNDGGLSHNRSRGPSTRTQISYTGYDFEGACKVAVHGNIDTPTLRSEKHGAPMPGYEIQYWQEYESTPTFRPTERTWAKLIPKS
ncbi:hypothetical protein EJ04DRAFT_158287 [Polyplosphaeria fusca]|uniref:F-box domain-containing protein n=1 Tax=Polyplosphaeria fusca TaxID=682080 RepID=A0A9P4UW78_9PLEO|nr:hypothetical protein EJ04DRAFT_158287 [Polyplosphaeria fusca]